jgi:hypothetical protein
MKHCYEADSSVLDFCVSVTTKMNMTRYMENTTYYVKDKLIDSYTKYYSLIWQT